MLGAAPRERPARLAVACVAALAAHALLLFAVRGTEGRNPQKRVQQRAQLDVRVYELDVPAPLPPPVAPPPERTLVERRAQARAMRDRSPTPPPSPETARAAAVVAREPDPGAPVDLTGDAIVTGQATAYAGGVTSSSGTRASPGRTGPPATATGDGAVATTALDRAGSVSLESEKWSCPWPTEADNEQIDEQTVILRVVVDATGAAEKAMVLSDPGHGFGPAAVACALRTRFVPARGRGGEAVKATSPPIRVRFTR